MEAHGYGGFKMTKSEQSHSRSTITTNLQQYIYITNYTFYYTCSKCSNTHFLLTCNTQKVHTYTVHSSRGGAYVKGCVCIRTKASIAMADFTYTGYQRGVLHTHIGLIRIPHRLLLGFTYLG